MCIFSSRFTYRLILIWQSWSWLQQLDHHSFLVGQSCLYRINCIGSCQLDSLHYFLHVLKGSCSIGDHGWSSIQLWYTVRGVGVFAWITGRVFRELWEKWDAFCLFAISSENYGMLLWYMLTRKDAFLFVCH